MSRPGYERGVPDEGWDERQRERAAHMLQSREWMIFQTALNREVFHGEADGWSWTGFLDGNFGFRHLSIPYGPTVSHPGHLPAALASLKTAARQEHADFVRCEPMGLTVEELRTLAESDVTTRSLSEAAHFQPDRTNILNIARPVSELRTQLASGHKTAINRIPRNGLLVTASSRVSDAPPVIELIRATAAKRQYQAHGEPYYKTMLETLMPLGFAKLALARLGDELLSAAISFDWNDTRAYAHAGNSEAALKHQSSVPLLWHLITDAQENGLTRFDFWGVAPPDVDSHPWAGLSRFKRGFGGTDVVYPGTWDLPVRPLKTKVGVIARQRARQLLRRSG